MKTGLQRMVLATALAVGPVSPAWAASFDAFFPTFLRHAGGFVDDPADPGGAMNKGVTMQRFQQTSKELLGIPPTLDNLKALSDAQAGIIHKATEWDKVAGDQIALQELANVVFDFYAEGYAGDAIKLLQSTLNDLGASPKVSLSSNWTPATLTALNKADQKVVYAKYKDGRKKYYNDLVARRPELGKYLKGWIARVDSFPKL